jgi:Tol biopolymer transport system component/DNA-binding winged helix-turn-helix (wHTH) protein
MEGLSTARKVVRFGLYEVDLAAQELRKSGIKIKLQEQPFQILALLLEKPGEIITREEIQKRLWAGDTFVDFDLGLNSAVKKLRQALGDESDNPRFVETLYRRGYRFLAPVQNGNPAVSLVPAFPGNGSSVSQAAHPSESQAQPIAPAASPRRATRLLGYLALPLLLAAGLLIGYLVRPSSPPHVTGYQEITHDGRQKYGIVSDGERIYIAEYLSGRFGVTQVSAAGGETSPVPSPFTNTMLGNILPDGSALLVGAFHELNKQASIWSIPLPGGAPRRLGDLVAESIVPTPDGASLLYSDRRSIYQAAADGSQEKKLLDAPGSPMQLTISPDARKLVYTVFDANLGANTLWIADRDGSQAHPLFRATEDTQHDSCARWSPDGKYLFFVRHRNGHHDIWVLPWSGASIGRQTEPVQLTNGPLDFVEPMPSRDGKRIYTIGEQPRTELVRYDGSSGFKPFLGGLSVTDVAFTSDGQWVTYVTIPDRALWRSRVDGTQRMQLSDPGKILAGLPRWSPDGKRIAFMGRTNTANWRAYLISADGGNFQDLIPGATAGFDPNWTADGKSIVVSTSDLGPSAQGISQVDLATGKVTEVPGSERLFSPRTSPDGKYLAAITTSSQSLMLFDVATQRWTELVRMPIGYPSWSHDGQYVYFDSILSEDAAFYRVRISDHKLERLADLSGIRRFWGEMAEWAGLGPDDSMLLTRDASNEEVYAIDWSPR